LVYTVAVYGLGMAETTQRLPIPTPIIEYARFAASEYIPPRRTGGFAETAQQKRGHGDFLELVAKLTLKHFLVVEHNVMVTLELTSGQGDETDMRIWFGSPETSWRPRRVDVKSSAFAPFHEGLNLCVKEAEARHRPADIYIQCFVHLDETDDPEPHMHLAGLVFTSWDIWQESLSNMQEIPNTNGARGVLIPCHRLRPVRALPLLCRPAWGVRQQRPTAPAPA
jgi:hypothetical protein